MTYDRNDLMLQAVDAKAWRASLKQLPSQFRVCFVTDLHVPDHDPRAFEVALKIVQDAKPHVVPHLSDAMDLRSVSLKFPATVREMAEDIWDGLENDYSRVTNELNSACPDDCAHPIIMGNHDVRAYKFILGKSPQFTNKFSRDFVGLVRDNGGLWLGIDHTHIKFSDFFLLAHGHDLRGNTPEKIGERSGWTHHIMYGHFHRHVEVTRQTQAGVRRIVGVGCLQHLRPAYQKQQGKNILEDWNHGIGIADVDLKRRTVDLQAVDIDITPGGKYYARWADKEYR